MSSLKDLNLKEVSARTQIEMDFLNAVIEKDFERLSRFNVKGFLKILTREYDLDFSDFLEEYETFMRGEEDEASDKEDKKVTIATQVDAYQQTSSGLWLWFMGIAVIIGGLIWAIYQYDLLKIFLDKQNEQHPSTAVVNIIDEAQNHLKESTQSEPSKQEEQEAPSASNSTNSANAENSAPSTTDQENEITQNDSKPKSLQEQINAQSEQERVPANSTSLAVNSAQDATDQSTSQSASALNTPQKEAIFSTNGKVWVGFIKLENGEKKAMVTENNFSADLSVPQLLLIGATEITLKDEQGQIHTFAAGSSKRFLIQDGVIKPITLAEFMRYNKGKEW